MYKCEFCNSEYSNPSDYAKCVNICYNKYVLDNEKKLREERLQKQKEQKLEIEKLYKDLRNKEQEYYKTYREKVVLSSKEPYSVIDILFGEDTGW